MNNGFASDLMSREEFDREIPCHHTCSALEVANISVRGNSDIKGIKVGKHEIKLVSLLTI